ncbi:hypothetical protein ENKNEFLB_03316 [Nocardioides aquaticus]|uniref:DUF3105 domain-containing protein n=1 Tax=Nocardioides aquaticus TaxID=160826 RepID=A0ABX8EM58_9ACTN|nr:DUF3105 domain-containing protein [Nocardioides aquaticus]QVT80915.1 hypothetical protein ENKNEFLB_03316 [Nocardioides aquaticus]
MAKSTKSQKSDRKATIDALTKKQRSAERGRGLAIVVVCVAVALVIVGAAAYRPIANWWELRQFEDVELASLGAPVSACGEVETKKAEGNQEHVPEGTPVEYEQSPPAFGAHYDTPDTMARKLYAADDRPDLRELVHNLEHGYTFVWYDETIAADDEAMTELRAVASQFPGTDNYRYKFKAVPWTEEDGEPFPDGQHVALTHWSAGGAGNTDVSEQRGAWQYCSEFSGEALSSFMEEYPYFDSPEPNGG